MSNIVNLAFLVCKTIRALAGSSHSPTTECVAGVEDLGLQKKNPAVSFGASQAPLLCLSLTIHK
jgi:hypothetical protein